MERFVFVTLANAGMVALTENMIRTVRSAGMTNNVVVACTDTKSRKVLEKLDGVLIIDVENEMTGSVTKRYSDYGSIKFQNMMMRKYPAVKLVMEDTRKDAIFVDSDIGFWRDVNGYFENEVRSDTDILCSVEPNGIGFCCGFTYFTNRKATFDFIDLIVSEQKKAFQDSDKFIGEQAIFNSIVTTYATKCPATVACLPETKFCNGHYLKTPGCWTKDGDVRNGIVRNDMYLAHANWIKGSKKKIRFLQNLGLYKRKKMWWQSIGQYVF